MTKWSSTCLQILYSVKTLPGSRNISEMISGTKVLSSRLPTCWIPKCCVRYICIGDHKLIIIIRVLTKVLFPKSMLNSPGDLVQLNLRVFVSIRYVRHKSDFSHYIGGEPSILRLFRACGGAVECLVCRVSPSTYTRQEHSRV